ncbi:MAG: ASCH domain-containing protein [Dongiaceae bacterium]
MIGEKTRAVEDFWQQCRKKHGIATNDYHAKTFADPRYSNYHDMLLDLVGEGKKRATAHMALDFEKNNVPRRKVGDYWVVVSTKNEPRYLVRVTDVTVTPFNQVKVEFASREGEGDSSLRYWAEVHREYFEAQCKDLGIPFPDDCPTVCEGFELIDTARK